MIYLLTTTIGKNVVIGGACLVSPGTIIEDNVMLGARSTTKIGQVLEEGWIYFGNPAVKLRKNTLAKEMTYKATELKEGEEREQYQVVHENKEGTEQESKERSE